MLKEMKSRCDTGEQKEEADCRATDGMPLELEEWLGLRLLKASLHHWADTG